MSTQAHTAARSAAANPASHGATIYYGSRGLILLAPSLVLDRPTSPLTATLRIACRQPYTIEVGGYRSLQTRASLVAPRAGRKRIVAVDSDMALFYFPLEMTEYAGLKDVLNGEDIVDLPFEPFEPLLPRLRLAMRGELDGSAVSALFPAAIEAITGKAPLTMLPLDARIRKARDIVDRMPLSDVSVEALAGQVHLSESRLRELFKEQVGATLSEYSRWRAIWRAANLWRDGRTLTDVAVEAGFHDLAHADKVFVETFGIRPSLIADSRYFRLIQCE